MMLAHHIPSYVPHRTRNVCTPAEDSAKNQPKEHRERDVDTDAPAAHCTEEVIQMVFILDAAGHNGHAYATRAEAEAEQQVLAAVLGVRCNIITCRCA